MLEYFWYAVGWTMGWIIVIGFQGLIWAMDLKNAAHEGWRRVSYSHGRNHPALKQILPILQSPSSTIVSGVGSAVADEGLEQPTSRV